MSAIQDQRGLRVGRTGIDSNASQCIGRGSDDQSGAPRSAGGVNWSGPHDRIHATAALVGKRALREKWSSLPEHFIAFPAEQFFGGGVPIDDQIVGVDSEGSERRCFE